MTLLQRGLGLAVTAMAISAVAAVTVEAGPYSRLQVLLPGEQAAPGTVTGKTGTPEDQTVGVPFDIRVRACDSDWATVTSVTNLITLTSTDGSADLPVDFLLGAGEATVSVTVNAGGSFLFTADDQSDGSIATADSSPFAALRLTGFEFSRINQKNQYAGVPLTITVTAVDPTGDAVEGYEGPVRLRQVTSFGEGRIEPAEITLSNGEWTGDVSCFRADETSISRGNVNIVAELPSDAAINGVSDPFVVHPGSFTRVQLLVPGQNPAPGSVAGLTGNPASQSSDQNFSVDVFATDDYWNPVPSSDQVRVTSSDSEASTPVTGSLSNGYVALNLSLSTVGSQTLTVSNVTNGSIQGMTSLPIPVTAASAHHFEFDAIVGPVTAGEEIVVTVRATDASGNQIPDFTGSAVMSANTGPGSISPELIAFSGGAWTGEVTLRGAGGAVALSCADFSSPPHIGSSDPIEVVAGPLAGLQVLLPGETPAGGTTLGHTGNPIPQNAGTSFNVRVRAVDEFWNLVTGIDHEIAIDMGDPFAAISDTPTLSNGEGLFPVTVYKAGARTVSASDVTDPGVAEGEGSLLLVDAGAYARIVLTLPGETVAPGSEDGRTGAATDQSISFAFTASVHATDEWWNPVNGLEDVIHLSATDPAAIIPGDTPMVNGVAEFDVRLSTGGFQQLTATNVTDAGMPMSTTQVRAISSGFHLEAEVTPLEVQAGEPFTLTVRVTNDAGSVMQEINSVVSVTVLNAASSNPGCGVIETAQFQLLQGERAIQQTYTCAEQIILVIQDDAGNEPAVTEAILVNPGDPDAVLLGDTADWIRGNQHLEVRARVVDEFGNGVPVQPVDFALLEGSGELTPIDVNTDDEGLARADYLSPRFPEFALIQATSGSLVGDIVVETALVDPSSAPGTITSYPNPFHPGETPTTVSYRLADQADVEIKIYTLSGTSVLTESIGTGVSGARAGFNEFIWDGENGDGKVVASGTYILQVTATGAGETLHVMRRRIAVVR
jgi:hypothetical protein